MSPQDRSNELFVIPCCATKVPGGLPPINFRDDLRDSISNQTYGDLLSARSEVLRRLRGETRYLSEKYSKNANIEGGPDFGISGSNGQYLPAIERYAGTLYSRPPGFVETVKKYADDPSKPKLLILSALYGPLHPLSHIQDYNLQMSDRPAYQVWKEHFPLFLEEYVRRFSTRKIRLYLGRTTAYFKIAKIAIRDLKDKRLIDHAIHYDVKGGGTYLTPYTHGNLVVSHLEGQRKTESKNNVIPKDL